jgi:hypothetical protein
MQGFTMATDGNWLLVAAVVIAFLTAGLSLLLSLNTRESLAGLEQAREHDGLDARVAQSVYEFFATPRHHDVLHRDICGHQLK